MPYAAHDRSDSVERYRDTLEGLAYRIIGTWADAQDIAQESLIRWHQLAETQRAEIASPRAWLIKTASRRAIDRLRSAQQRRMSYVGPWLPEPWLQDDRSPASAAETDESVTMALMVALERLSASERAAFILHDVFDLPFAEISQVLGKSVEACRQLATRARASIRSGKPRYELRAELHERLLQAFLKAVVEGDTDGLASVLAEDVVLYSDGGANARAARKVLRSFDVVSRLFLGLARKKSRQNVAFRTEYLTVNGLPAAALYENGQLSALLSLAVENGRIASIFQQRNPEKLRAFLPRS